MDNQYNTTITNATSGTVNNNRNEATPTTTFNLNNNNPCFNCYYHFGCNQRWYFDQQPGDDTTNGDQQQTNQCFRSCVFTNSTQTNQYTTMETTLYQCFEERKESKSFEKWSQALSAADIPNEWPIILCQ